MKNIIKDSVGFYRNHFRLIFSVFFPVYLLEILTTNIIEYSFLHVDGNLFLQSLYVLLTFVFHSIYTASLIILFGSIISGNYPPPLKCIQKGVVYLPIFIATEIMVSFFTFAGFILLIVPGIIIGIKLSLAQFYLVLLDETPINALKKSYKATEGFTSTIFYALLQVAIPIFLLRFIVEIIFSDLITPNPVISMIIDFIFGCITVIFPILLFRFFCIVQESELKVNNT